ncbi:MAG: SMI1/KNR4 family protein [Ardenticatenaceae bacterium]|nr:SMI1/KNR4 family protein [Ardenticatenaceae bacterium]
MSMRDYELAANMMEEHPNTMDFIGPRPESLVRTAEQALGVTFPPTYRRFLLEYGAGGFGSSEIYGVIDENFEESSIPDAIWYTLTERKEVNLPNGLVVIYAVGDGGLYCLDLQSKKVDEAPVVVYEPGLPNEEQFYEVVAKDFGEFLLDLVQREINWMRS